MSSTIRCQSKNPATWRFHGTAGNKPFALSTTQRAVLAPSPSENEDLLKPGTQQHKIFLLFKDINEEP